MGFKTRIKVFENRNTKLNGDTDIERLLQLLSVDHSSEEQIQRLTPIVDIHTTICDAQSRGYVEPDSFSGKFRITSAGLDYLEKVGAWHGSK